MVDSQVMCRSQHLFQITAPVQQLMELDSVAMAGERVRVYVCTIWDVAALCYDVDVDVAVAVAV